jgi:hypothetical protein
MPGRQAPGVPARAAVSVGDEGSEGQVDNSVTKSPQAQQLEGELNRRVVSFGKSMYWYRRRYLLDRLSLAAISAAIAVLSGVKGFPLSADATSNIVLTLSSLSTVLAVWGTVFLPRESWQLYAESYGRLRALKARLDFDLAGDRTEADVEKHFGSYQTILSEHNAQWREVREKRTTQPA